MKYRKRVQESLTLETKCVKFQDVTILGPHSNWDSSIDLEVFLIKTENNQLRYTKHIEWLIWSIKVHYLTRTRSNRMASNIFKEYVHFLRWRHWILNFLKHTPQNFTSGITGFHNLLWLKWIIAKSFEMQRSLRVCVWQPKMPKRNDMLHIWWNLKF